MRPGDEVIIRDSWGAIDYKGPGYFIAGGAGITPFVAILRSLYAENKIAGNRLFFSNKTAADIIYKDELQKMLGKDAVFILTREKDGSNEHGGILTKHLSEIILRNSINIFMSAVQDRMVFELVETLQKTGASMDALVFEK